MTADATLPASDDLTPEVLARWESASSSAEAMRDFYGDRFETGSEIDLMLTLADAVPALLSGVRSRDARIAELEALLAANHRAYLSAIGADHE